VHGEYHRSAQSDTCQLAVLTVLRSVQYEEYSHTVYVTLCKVRTTGVKLKLRVIHAYNSTYSGKAYLSVTTTVRTESIPVHPVLCAAISVCHWLAHQCQAAAQ
jgi:hypothetical protein